MKQAGGKAVGYRQAPKEAGAVLRDGETLNRDCGRRPCAPKWQIHEGSSPLLPSATKRAPILGPELLKLSCVSNPLEGLIKCRLLGPAL